MAGAPLVTTDNLSPQFVLNNALQQIQLVVSTTTQEIYQECHAGGSEDGLQSGAWARNATVTRTALGRWDVVFNAAHPDGTNYHPSLSVHESSADRDVPKVSVVEGTKTSSGFSIQLTTDDNGGTADVYDDAQWSFGVSCPVTVITGVSI